MTSAKIASVPNKNPTRERALVRASIKALLQSHASDPFGILREAGVQAELRGILLTRFVKPATARLRAHDGKKRFRWPTRMDIERVQLEMKVGGARTDAKSSETNSASRTDIVVLTTEHPVDLICYPNGPGDVVAALRAKDVKVAIEIKASPSKKSEQKRKYANDIKRLLQLNSSHGIASFFVMLDKSQSLYGDYLHKARGTTIDENNWAVLKALIPSINISAVLTKSVHRYIEIWFLDVHRKPNFIHAWFAATIKRKIHDKS